MKPIANNLKYLLVGFVGIVEPRSIHKDDGSFQIRWEPSTCNRRQQHIGGFERSLAYAIIRFVPKSFAAFLISSATKAEN